ncbi:hypothetical protein QQ045_027516 [Rhodiola kirilowii]
MKTKTLGIFLFMLLVVSSLEFVWTNEVTDIDAFHEFDAFDNAPDAFDAIDDKLDDGIVENAVHHKDACIEIRSGDPLTGRCSIYSCKKSCYTDGYENGRCLKSRPLDNVEECYCQKHCKKDRHADPPSHPVEVSSDEETVPFTNSYDAYRPEEADVLFP